MVGSRHVWALNHELAILHSETLPVSFPSPSLPTPGSVGVLPLIKVALFQGTVSVCLVARVTVPLYFLSMMISWQVASPLKHGLRAGLADPPSA